MSTVLHVVDRISGGGPTRSLIALVKHLSRVGAPQQHRMIALRRDAYPIARVFAKQAGLTVILQPDADTLRSEVASADIVQLHYWNNPEVGELLRAELPAMRLLIWFVILGRYAPQIVTEKLLRHADVAVATTPATLELPVLRDANEEGLLPTMEVIPGTADFDRIAGLRPQPHPNFNVGYVGTVNFSKMHPRYVAMSAAVNLPNVRFVVCGAGDTDPLQAEAAQRGAADRFEWRGFVENIKPVLETLDVFGYPLCEETYAACEGCLQEAMMAQVPPVVFPHGGLKHLVEHEETGLVVHSEEDYAAAIEHLYHNPDERLRLGRNARAFALKTFDGETAARGFMAIYERMMERPKRQLAWEGAQTDGALHFLEALGDTCPEFALSLAAKQPEEWREADQKIAAASTLLSSGEGGIFHYRNHYPDAPYLRFWAGLILLRHGRRAQAERELEAAARAGLGFERVAEYLDAAKRGAEA